MLKFLKSFGLFRELGCVYVLKPGIGISHRTISKRIDSHDVIRLIERRHRPDKAYRVTVEIGSLHSNDHPCVRR